MKILFDARWINANKPDGITRFSREIIKELAKLRKINLWLLICSTNQLVDLPKLPFIETNNPTSVKEFVQAKNINNYEFDVVYSPHFIFGGKERKFLLVRTVLDLIPFHHRDKQGKVLWKIFHSNMIFLEKILKDSDGLVTISNTIKKELEKITNKQIAVVGCAPTKINIENSGKSKELLYIGRYESYKNIETLIAAMEFLPDYTLFLAGNCPVDRKKELMKKSVNKRRIKFLGQIDDSIYYKKLANIRALVFASREEGFGLPLVEAMSVGCPVVCSDINIFHEVAGRAALFFDPDSPAELAKKIKKLEDPNFRSNIVKVSRERSKQFSWKKSADRLQSFLLSLLDDKEN